MCRRLLFLGGIAAAAAACASGTGGGGGGGAAAGPAVAPQQPTAPGGRRAADGVRLGPSALRYVIHRQVHAVQEFGGQRQKQDLGFRIFLAATIAGPVDSVGYPTTLTIDSLVADSGVALPPTMNLAAARGVTLTGRLAARGELKELALSDSAAVQPLGQAVGNLRSFYPRIPEHGLKLGAAWIDTVTSTEKTGTAEVTVTSINHWNAATWEDRGGTSSLRLDMAATFSLAGVGEGGGQPFEMTGTGTRSGVEFLAADGRYLGGESRDSSSIQITLPAQGLVVPVLQVVRSTITVLP